MICLYPVQNISYETFKDRLNNNIENFIICDDINKLFLYGYRFISYKDEYNIGNAFVTNNDNVYWVLDIYPIYHVDKKCPYLLICSINEPFICLNKPLYQELTTFSNSIYSFIEINHKHEYVMQEYDFINDKYKYYIITSELKLVNIFSNYLNSALISKLKPEFGFREYHGQIYLTLNNSASCVLPFINKIDIEFFSLNLPYETLMHRLNVHSLSNLLKYKCIYSNRIDNIQLVINTIEARSAFKQLFLKE